MRYHFTRQAQQDIYALVDHILIENPRSARVVGDEVVRVCRLLGEAPHIGQSVPFVEDAEYFFIPAGKYKQYLIFYTIEDRGVVIRRVLHTRRNIRELLG